MVMRLNSKGSRSLCTSIMARETNCGCPKRITLCGRGLSMGWLFCARGASSGRKKGGKGKRLRRMYTPARETGQSQVWKSREGSNTHLDCVGIDSIFWGRGGFLSPSRVCFSYAQRRERKQRMTEMALSTILCLRVAAALCESRTARESSRSAERSWFRGVRASMGAASEVLRG